MFFFIRHQLLNQLVILAENLSCIQPNPLVYIKVDFDGLVYHMHVTVAICSKTLPNKLVYFPEIYCYKYKKALASV